MQLHDIGQIKCVWVPDHLAEFSSDSDELIGARWSKVFKAKDGSDRKLTFFFRGLPIDDKSARYFLELLQDKPANNGPQQLSAEEIKSLFMVLGLSTVGNNQYSNPAPAEALMPPAFQLEIAETIAVNGKTVLRVSGCFRGGTHYRGIFFPGSYDGRIVEELFCQSEDKERLKEIIDDLDGVLKTIDWVVH
jgi:hypothetical protein